MAGPQLEDRGDALAPFLVGQADDRAVLDGGMREQHRLWYDLRNQSLFEESFRADVLEIDQRREEMIWRVISRYAEFAGIAVAVSPGAAYAMLDGLFQQALLHHLAGNDHAADDLAASVVRVLDTLAVAGP